LHSVTETDLAMFSMFFPTGAAQKAAYSSEGWLGSVVVGRRTCDREVTGSTPVAALFGQQPWASCSHLMCLCSPSSLLGTLRAFMLKRHTVRGSGIGSNEQGDEYCRAVLKRFWRIAKNRDINHLLYFTLLLQNVGQQLDSR